MSYRLGIIGGGNMGAAIARGAVKHGVLPASELIVADVDEAKCTAVGRLGCTVTNDVAEAGGAEQILLAVKPQVFPEVAKAIAPLPESKVVISIMAGLSSGPIRNALGEHARVVRVMPNTPCQVGAGMAAIALGEGADTGDDALTERLFGAIGETARVREEQMYAVTAVSGSGPAYVFLVAEAMQEAAQRMGLEPAVARVLVNQTIRGAGRLLRVSDESARELRDIVATPGGTTAAALKVMCQRELIGIFTDALGAARDRGMELDQAG